MDSVTMYKYGLLTTPNKVPQPSPEAIFGSRAMSARTTAASPPASGVARSTSSESVVTVSVPSSNGPAV